jgi:hypothetical protein
LEEKMAEAVTALVPVENPGLMLVHGAERAEAFARASKATNTTRGYRSDWRQFEAWCSARGVSSLPAEPRIVALYIADLAVARKPATIGRHLAAIASAHKSRGYESPCSMRHGSVSSVWHGIRRTHGVAQNQKSPLLTADLRRITGELPEKLIGKRDRALLLVGFAGAFRRSELVALDAEDCSFTSDGLVVTLRRSKTDQEGVGRKVGIPYGSNPDTCYRRDRTTSRSDIHPSAASTRTRPRREHRCQQNPPDFHLASLLSTENMRCVLVQREMESRRSPLASIPPIPKGNWHRRKRLRPGGRGRRRNRNWFQQKGSQFGGSHSQQGRALQRKPTGYEKNIEHKRCQAPQQAAVPAASRWCIPAAAVASGVRRVFVSG